MSPIYLILEVNMPREGWSEAEYIKIAREKCEKHYNEIKKKYIDGVSLKELCDNFNIGSRSRLEKMLVADGVILRTSKTCHIKRSRDKARKTFLKKYGVDNITKLEKMKDHLRKINYENQNIWQGKRQIIQWMMGRENHPNTNDNFSEYKKECLRLTKINKEKLLLKNKCFYTDILFDKTKHNGNFFPSLDHKISIVRGFELGITPKKIANVNNLVWCLRIVNSLKREYTDKEFQFLKIPDRIKKAYNEKLL